MRRFSAAVAFSLAGAAVLSPGQSWATMEPLLGLNTTESRTVNNVNQTNEQATDVRTQTNTIKSQIDQRTGKSGPPPMGGSGLTYLNSDGVASSGLSAGDHGWPTISLWTSIGHTSFSDDHPSVNVDSGTHSFTFGGDVQIIDSLIAGLSFSYDDTHAESELPLAGGGVNDANDDTNTYTVAPYAVFIIDEVFDIDGSFGFSWADTDSDRFNGATVVTSDSDTDGWFFALNGNATVWFDYLGLTGSVGYRRSSSTTDRYTESDGTVVQSNETTLGTIVTRARASYYYPTGLEVVQAVLPFISVTAEWDHTRDEVDVGATQAQPANDQFGLVISGGVNLSIIEGLTAGIEASGIALRSEQSSTTVSGNISFSF